MKRLSDKKLYIGITTKARLNKRLNCHRIDERFKGDNFECDILEESSDREYIENQEEYWITKLNTFEDGLNDSWSGKGFGHNSPNFTTLGYKFTPEQRQKMSISAKKRAVREGFEVRSKASKKGWERGGEEYRKHMSEIRKGRCLHQNYKLSPKDVKDMIAHFHDEYNSLLEEVERINDYRQRKNKSWKLTTPINVFAKNYCASYGVSNKRIEQILKQHAQL